MVVAVPAKDLETIELALLDLLRDPATRATLEPERIDVIFAALLRLQVAMARPRASAEAQSITTGP